MGRLVAVLRVLIFVGALLSLSQVRPALQSASLTLVSAEGASPRTVIPNHNTVLRIAFTVISLCLV